MPAFDAQKIRERRQAFKEQGGRGRTEYFALPVGDTIIWVAPATEEMEGVPFMEFCEHKNVGPDKKMVFCLNSENNGPILRNAAFQALLAARKVPLDQVCPICEMLKADDISVLPPEFQDEDALVGLKVKQGAYFVVVPVGEIDDSKRIDYIAQGKFPKPRLAKWSGSLAGPVMDKMALMDDPTDPDAAGFVVVTRTGTTKNNTRYSAEVDVVTVKAPVKIPKPVRFAVEKACGDKGDCNIIRLIARFWPTTEKVEAMLRGVETEASRVEDDLPPCCGIDYKEDAECEACPAVEQCKEKMAAAAPARPASRPAVRAVPRVQPRRAVLAAAPAPRRQAVAPPPEDAPGPDEEEEQGQGSDVPSDEGPGPEDEGPGSDASGDELPFDADPEPPRARPASRPVASAPTRKPAPAAAPAAAPRTRAATSDAELEAAVNRRKAARPQ